VQKVRVNSQRDLRGWRIETRDAEWAAIKPWTSSHIGQANGYFFGLNGGQMAPRANSCIHAHLRSVNPRHTSRAEYSRSVFWTVNCRWDVERVATAVTMTFVIPGWRCPYCDKLQEMGTMPVWKTMSAIPQQTVIKPLRSRRPKRKSRVGLSESRVGFSESRVGASESEMRTSCSDESVTNIEAGGRHLRHRSRPAISASYERLTVALHCMQSRPFKFFFWKALLGPVQQPEFRTRI
jgi:hypothetical protein